MTNPRANQPRLLSERAVGTETAGSSARRPARSVTVNLAESPLGWLFARGHVSRRQLDAGEQLRRDWEKAQLAPRVTMAWDCAPVARSRGGSAQMPDLSGAQIDARRRFDEAVRTAGPGLADILWRVVCSGEGMAHVPLSDEGIHKLGLRVSRLTAGGKAPDSGRPFGRP